MTERKRELKIPCTLVQDLLPLYIEQLTSEGSDQLLQEHLAACEDCRNQEALLRSAVDATLTEQQQEEKAEINYLKKLRRSSRRKFLFGLLAALALLAVLCSAGLKLYVFGFNVDYELDRFFVQPMNDSTTAYTVHVQGHVTDKFYCRYKLVTDSEGNDNLKIYARLPLPWEDSKKDQYGRLEDSKFDLFFRNSEVNGYLTTPELSVGPNYSTITIEAKKLYEAKHPYVGDMPANMKLADVVIGSDFESELQTEEEPYSWTLHFKDPVSDIEAFEQEMQYEAYLMLMLIDNLGEVRWTYAEKTADGSIKHEGSLDVTEASFLYGTYVKNQINSAYDMQRWLDFLFEARISKDISSKTEDVEE